MKEKKVGHMTILTIEDSDIDKLREQEEEEEYWINWCLQHTDDGRSRK